VHTGRVIAENARSPRAVTSLRTDFFLETQRPNVTAIDDETMSTYWRDLQRPYRWLADDKRSFLDKSSAKTKRLRRVMTKFFLFYNSSRLFAVVDNDFVWTKYKQRTVQVRDTVRSLKCIFSTFFWLTDRVFISYSRQRQSRHFNVHGLVFIIYELFINEKCIPHSLS